eukprot:8836119-Prorocentrum_lima.AAC.1
MKGEANRARTGRASRQQQTVGCKCPRWRWDKTTTGQAAAVTLRLALPGWCKDAQCARQGPRPP